MSQPIIWDIDPVILQIYGPFGIRWYSLLFLLGFLIGHAAFGKFLRDAGKPVDLREPLLYYVVFGTIIGARLGHCLFYDPVHYLTHPLDILQTWEGGLASHGGYLGVMVALFLFSRKHRETSFFWLADRVAIVAILAGCFIRLGNFFNSEVIGKPSELPWAMIFARIDQIPRHPTQIYEALSYLAVSIILYTVYRLAQKNPLEGRLYGLVMVLGYGMRIFLETFKENQERFEDGMLLNMGQLLSIPFILLGLCLVLGIHRNWKFLSWAFTQDTPTTGSSDATANRRRKSGKRRNLKTQPH